MVDYLLKDALNLRWSGDNFRVHVLQFFQDLTQRVIYLWFLNVTNKINSLGRDIFTKDGAWFFVNTSENSSHICQNIRTCGKILLIFIISMKFWGAVQIWLFVKIKQLQFKYLLRTIDPNRITIDNKKWFNHRLFSIPPTEKKNSLLSNKFGV